MNTPVSIESCGPVCVNTRWLTVCPTVYFSQISHDVLRGIVGFWAAATYVSSVSVLGRSFHAGSRWRVVGFCLYGAMAPVGAYIGAMAWGLILQETDHRWPYWSM